MHMYFILLYDHKLVFESSWISIEGLPHGLSTLRIEMTNYQESPYKETTYSLL